MSPWENRAVLVHAEQPGMACGGCWCWLLLCLIFIHHYLSSKLTNKSSDSNCADDLVSGTFDNTRMDEWSPSYWGESLKGTPLGAPACKTCLWDVRSASTRKVAPITSKPTCAPHRTTRKLAPLCSVFRQYATRISVRKKKKKRISMQHDNHAFPCSKASP